MSCLRKIIEIKCLLLNLNNYNFINNLRKLLMKRHFYIEALGLKFPASRCPVECETLEEGLAKVCEHFDLDYSSVAAQPVCDGWFVWQVCDKRKVAYEVTLRP